MSRQQRARPTPPLTRDAKPSAQPQGAADADVALVQFPHPGTEHRPAGLGVMPWYSGPHRRKFMVAEGIWVADGGQAGGGLVNFWGEWEAPSRVLSDGVGEIGMPRYLHRPLRPAEGDSGSNTDPFVFGQRFYYSNCRQLRNRKLRDLPIGSLMLFGSKVRRRFVLDTALVVADRHPLDCARLNRGDSAFRRVSLRPLQESGEPLDRLVLYEGATPDRAIDGMFSFVPARPHDDGEWGFHRPCLAGSYLNDNLAMAARVQMVASSQVAKVWAEVTRRVFDAGLVLATHLSPATQTAAASASGGQPVCSPKPNSGSVR